MSIPNSDKFMEKLYINNVIQTESYMNVWNFIYVAIILFVMLRYFYGVFLWLQVVIRQGG